jgi:hypothetical protein
VNLANLQKRVEAAKAKLEELQAEPPRPLLRVRLVREVNPNAPEGTQAADEDDGLPDSFVMVPPGNHEPLPEGLLTFEQWQLLSDRSVAKGDGHVN